MQNKKLKSNNHPPPPPTSSTKVLDVKLINHLIKQKIPVVVSSPSVYFSFSTFILSQKNTTLVLKNTVPLDCICSVANKKEFMVQLPEYSLFCQQTLGNGVDFIFNVRKVRSNSEQYAKRSFRRASLPSSKKGTLKIINPFDKITQLNKTLLTISQGGLSFQTNYPSLMFTRGQIISNCKIYFDNKFFAQADIKISYQKKYFDTNSLARFQIGAEFLKPIAHMEKVVQAFSLS